TKWNRFTSLVVVQWTCVVKSRRQLRNGKVKLFWCLCNRSQLATRSGRIAQINLEFVPVGILLSDRQHRPAKFQEGLESRDVPCQSFRSRFMRPTVKAQWCRSREVEVEHTPNSYIRHTQMYRYNLSKIERIQHQCFHTSFCYLA